jgi:hypothetical protein
MRPLDSNPKSSDLKSEGSSSYATSTWQKIKLDLKNICNEEKCPCDSLLKLKIKSDFNITEAKK